MINPVVFNALTFTKVTCSDWVDEDGISSYIFYKASPGSSSLSLISSSNTESFNFTINSGNYDIYVEAMDKYGAVSNPLFVGTVTVNSVSAIQCQVKLYELHQDYIMKFNVSKFSQFENSSLYT